MKNSRKNNFNGYCGENAALCPGKKMMPGSVSLKIRKITFFSLDLVSSLRHEARTT